MSLIIQMYDDRFRPYVDLGSDLGEADYRWNYLYVKDILLSDAIIMKHIDTPTTPYTGYVKLYVKSNNKLYRLDSLGTETLIG
jgi:hypothetical protein